MLMLLLLLLLLLLVKLVYGRERGMLLLLLLVHLLMQRMALGFWREHRALLLLILAVRIGEHTWIELVPLPVAIPGDVTLSICSAISMNVASITMPIART